MGRKAAEASGLLKLRTGAPQAGHNGAGVVNQHALIAACGSALFPDAVGMWCDVLQGLLSDCFFYSRQVFNFFGLRLFIENLRGYLPSFLILNFAPLAPQLWGEQESICF
ncbi:hypothetical protein BJP36_34370 [Moorena producens JHB]|uniref:Uncharacterized protein n=1 Tax=Moorena producens (strain JHB) TaxID=1454205 RepID=A0A1D9G9D1_MOOP1|nr:hypothetical protein BJP36_34370 [Moorena producens JHB]